MYEAVVLAIRRFREDPWTAHIGSATVLDVEPREPTTKHSISLQQVERWLTAATSSPLEATKKAKLKVMLVQGYPGRTRASGMRNVGVEVFSPAVTACSARPNKSRDRQHLREYASERQYFGWPLAPRITSIACGASKKSWRSWTPNAVAA